MKKRLLAILSVVLFANQVSADHFNKRNIAKLCAADNEFSSTCYTYIAAYKDFLAFFVTATEEERARSLCLLDLETHQIADRLASEQSGGSPQIARLIMDEFCN